MSRRDALGGLRELARSSTDGVGRRDVLAHSRTLYFALLHHFESLDGARSAGGVRGLTRPRTWTRERVIGELRRLYKAGVRVTEPSLVAAGAQKVVRAARELFGSLPRARSAARIATPIRPLVDRQGWDEDTVIADIRTRYRRRESLAYSKVPRRLTAAARYYLGSWRGAIEAAGFDYDRIRLVRAPYERGELLDLLRKIHRSAPHMTIAELSHRRAGEAWIREFGSISAAGRAAGLGEWPLRRRTPLRTREQVLAAIRERRAAGASLRYRTVERDDARLVGSAVRRFGSWERALAAVSIRIPARPHVVAGLPRSRWTRQAVVSALRRRRRSGRPMNPSAIRADDPSLFGAARRWLRYDEEMAQRDWGAPRTRVHWSKTTVIEALRYAHGTGRSLRSTAKRAAAALFGSIPRARLAAGLPLPRTEWDDARVIREVRALRGRAASSTLRTIASRRFGSWRAALAAAGVAPTRRAWTTTSIRAALDERIAGGREMTTAAVIRDDHRLYQAVHKRFGAWNAAITRYRRSGRLSRR